ncbi:MAG: ankyrin repeat domain-containing protein [Proteobacteria bacterium]|nr:ankyrin repeat domain-containing protein [Pseudomonadota bacterium]
MGISALTAGCNAPNVQQPLVNEVTQEAPSGEANGAATQSVPETAANEAKQPENGVSNDTAVVPETPQPALDNLPSGESKPESGHPNAETEVTDDRDAILEEIVKCYPCFANPKADKCNSSKECDGVEELVKNGTYLSRFFDNNQAAFDARLKILQKEIDECVDAFVNRETYTARSEPECDYVFGEYSTLRELQSEKADADWLKAHKLPDSYRIKNEKEWGFKSYCGCSECRNKSGYVITNSFDFAETNEELLPDIISVGTIELNKADEDGNTLMHRYGRNPAIAKALIEKGADLTLKNKDGKCAFYGIEESLRRELILSGLDTSKVINSDGNTTLHSYANDVEVAKVLIQSGADVHQKNEEGRTPIFYARSVDAFKLLIDRGADIKALDNHHHTLLHAALNTEILSFLHGLGLDVNAQNDDGRTPIFFADSMDALKWYIDHGADVKVTDKHGNNLLHSKAFNSEMRGMMLNYNLDINAQNDEGQTPLFLVDLKNTDLLSAYIKAGADINAEDKLGNTIAHYQFAPKDSWELLLQSGFNINTKNDRDEPAWFVRYKQECLGAGDRVVDSWELGKQEEELLDAYLVHGADVHVHDDHGNTLLHRTLKCDIKDDKEIDCYDESLQFSKSRIEKLIKAGIDVNERNEEGYTPIFSCIYKEASWLAQYDDDCFNLLKELGADIHATTNKGDNLFTECIREACNYYNLLFKNQLHQNLSETTIQLALEAYKKTVFDRDATCRSVQTYDPADDGIDEYCWSYLEDQQLLPLMMDYGLDLKDGYMCILGAPKAETNEQKQKVADVINEKICGGGCTAFNQRNWSESEIDRFIRAGADINTQDDEGKTPLMKNGIDFDGTDAGPYDCINVNKITQFVKNGADINLRDHDGKTILNYVIHLLNDGSNSYCPGTPCGLSAECNIDIVSYLIKNGADVSSRIGNGETILMYATDHCNEKLIKQLINKGADVNAKDNSGKSALMYAVVKPCDEKLVKLLIAKGADVNAKDNDGTSVLMHAAERGGQEVIKLLIAKGADINDKDNDGTSVLAYGAAECNENLIKQLIAKGADVNAKDNKGKSVLMYTSVSVYGDAYEKCSGPIELLINKGADVHAKDNGGKSVLMNARQTAEYIEHLIAKGADVNAQDDNGKSVLMYSIQKCNRRLIELLIDKGADINAKDNTGKSVLEYAAGCNEVIKELLKNKGANEERAAN